jgi:hypothetical protein
MAQKAGGVKKTKCIYRNTKLVKRMMALVYSLVSPVADLPVSLK